MGIRDLLKKKDRLEEAGSSAEEPDTLSPLSPLSAPDFTFIRSDTHSQEQVFPPDHPAGYDHAFVDGASEKNVRSQYLTAGGGPNSASSSRNRLSLDVFRSNSGGGRSRSTSVSSSKSAQSLGHGQGEKGDRPSAARRLSSRLHLQRTPSTSEVVPTDLPAIVTPSDGEPPEGVETQWEARATMLAMENGKRRPATPSRGSSFAESEKLVSPPGSAGFVSNKEVDDDIQEAIRLHEAGDLARSTAMFGRLANPAGANNPLSQVLYGLALRYVVTHAHSRNWILLADRWWFFSGLVRW
jgi:hypothetical protein